MFTKLTRAEIPAKRHFDKTFTVLKILNRNYLESLRNFAKEALTKQQLI